VAFVHDIHAPYYNYNLTNHLLIGVDVVAYAQSLGTPIHPALEVLRAPVLIPTILGKERI